MLSIPDAVEALEQAIQRVERATAELEAAKQAQRNLERIILPPLFTKARQKVFTHENGMLAKKRLGCHARWPTDAGRHGKATAWMTEIGHIDSIKATVTAAWGKGEYELAVAAFEALKKDSSASVKLADDVHWKTYEKIVLETVQGGKHPVPFDDIGAEIFDEVTLTKRPKAD